MIMIIYSIISLTRVVRLSVLECVLFVCHFVRGGHAACMPARARLGVRCPCCVAALCWFGLFVLYSPRLRCIESIPLMHQAGVACREEGRPGVVCREEGRAGCMPGPQLCYSSGFAHGHTSASPAGAAQASSAAGLLFSCLLFSFFS